MKNAVDIFAELGEVILATDNEATFREAGEQNNWLLVSDIERAVDAICCAMLSRDVLTYWMANYPSLPVTTPERVLIVMAGNIPLVGFFDLLCVIAAGHHAIVKPSHKDRLLMGWIIKLLKGIEPTLPIYMYSEGDAVDRVIATGGESAVLHFSSLYRGIPTLLRGSRHSVAIITLEDQTEGLKEDIYSYSGLGCRNVSLIFAPKGYDLANIPTCEAVNPKYKNNYLQTKAMLTLSKAEFFDTGISCLIYQAQFPLALSTISIVEYDTMEQVERWIALHDDELQCIVAARETIKHPRRVDFGEAQHPTLSDYADGVDTMKFLE